MAGIASAFSGGGRRGQNLLTADRMRRRGADGKVALPPFLLATARDSVIETLWDGHLAPLKQEEGLCEKTCL